MSFPLKSKSKSPPYPSFYLAIILEVKPNLLRCSDVEIDYGSVSLDMNSVVEYITRQLLSLDMIKTALKKGELPLRNLFYNALKVAHVLISE